MPRQRAIRLNGCNHRDTRLIKKEWPESDACPRPNDPTANCDYLVAVSAFECLKAASSVAEGRLAVAAVEGPPARRPH
jgi:hypothetical protein